MSNDKKTIALALGGGGARGFAHVGILEVMEEHEIKVDYIAGTSMGSVIGAMYALDMPLVRIKEIAMHFQNINFSPMEYMTPFHESLLSGDFIEEGLRQVFGDAKFEDCRIPFSTLAIDLESGKEVIFDKGLISEALRAAVSIPIIFPPHFYQDRYLVDGAVLNNVPVSLLVDKKADLLLGVKLANYTSQQYISGMVYAKYQRNKYQDLFKKAGIIEGYIDQRKRDIKLLIGIALRALDIAAADGTERRINESHPDYIIKPDVLCGHLEFEKAQESIAEGRRSMEESLPELYKIMDEKGIKYKR
jgi:predicted acylesterase/phospholipase RssA